MQKQRRRFKQTDALEVRLANEAMRLKEAARTTPPGSERERLLRRARQADTGAHISEWLRSPGLRPPTKTYPTSHQRLQQLRAKIAEQIEIVAQLICESKGAVRAETELRELKQQLAKEEERTALADMSSVQKCT
jgi:hypothetical protein